MIIRSQVCGTDPCGRWKSPPAIIFHEPYRESGDVSVYACRARPSSAPCSAPPAMGRATSRHSYLPRPDGLPLSVIGAEGRELVLALEHAGPTAVWRPTGHEGIVTLASFACQSRDALIGRIQVNQWVGEFGNGAGHLQNPLFLADVTMPMKLVVNAAVDVGIGPAGDVWVTNNWQYHPAALGKVDEALSTLGGGQGVVVFFGMAKPVKTPLIGPPGQP